MAGPLGCGPFVPHRRNHHDAARLHLGKTVGCQDQLPTDPRPEAGQGPLSGRRFKMLSYRPAPTLVPAPRLVPRRRTPLGRRAA
jgi:hypothetical protein